MIFKKFFFLSTLVWGVFKKYLTLFFPAKINAALLAGASEYTDCVPAEW